MLVDIKMASTSDHEAASPLNSWHRQYLETEAGSIWKNTPVIQALQSDELDYDEIEIDIQRLVPNVDVFRGFCGKCRWSLDHWPDTSEEALVDSGFKVFTLGSPVHTREVEAAARAGCKFCTFLFSKLREFSDLDTFRRIERRLYLLGSDHTATISVQLKKNDPGQLLWLNYPQKTAPASHWVGAQICSTLSERVSPVCESKLACVIKVGC